MRLLTKSFSQEHSDTMVRTIRELSEADTRPGRGSAARLRQELAARNLQWAERQGFLHEVAIGDSPCVLYRPDAQGRHGNFHPASYKCILRNPEWNRRLAKAHTTARRVLVSHDRERRELDSCNSSDALLMNIFCHPQSWKERSGLRSYLGVAPDAPLVFGYKPRIPRRRTVDCTEVDLRWGDLLIEAKLTEGDFQSAPWKRAEAYRDLDIVFDTRLLPGNCARLYSYQLVRGILAAFAEEGCRYSLVCDARRGDLIELWTAVLRAMRSHDQRWRCVLVTWQELSQALCPSLQRWLRDKYGIAAAA